MEEKEKIIEIEIERLRDFKEHPFQVKDDEEMRQLKDSISEYGVLNPLIVRPRPEGVYEIISGHRRKYASQKLGYTKLPVIIRVMTDEEAIIAMIDSNLQREKISHSEKAYAYMMKNEALKRKVGRKRSQSGHRLKGKKTVELISEASGDSPKQVQHLLLLICRNISMICRRIRKMTDQYAIYRVNLLTEGKNLWQKSFEQVRKEHLPVRIDLYRQIHISFSEKDESVMEIWKKTRNITEVSDVLVLNHSGEISCYYVNEDAPRRITGFIRLNPSGTLVSLDTRDYKIEGYEGNWMAADDMIIDGRQFFLMEHQEFHRQAAMIVLDSYGRKVVEECKEGFNQEVKDKIYSFLQSHEKKRYPNKEQKQRLEFWQKFFENGHYERAGDPAEYDPSFHWNGTYR